MPEVRLAPEARRRVMIVEDDALLSALLSEAVSRAGFDALTAANGVEALDLSRNWQPHLAVLDNRLPDTSGIQLAATLRASGDTQFIFLSACADEGVVARAAELGALAYLVKPIDIGAIGPLMTTAVARADERRRLQQAIAATPAGVALDAAEQERKQLAAELHDGLGQELAGASMLAEALERRVARGESIEYDGIRELRTVLHEAQYHCRGLAHEMFGVATRGTDLSRALARLAAAEAARGPADCTFIGPRDLPDGVSDVLGHQLYRIAQEALRNASQHSGAARIVIRLSIRGGCIELSVEDDGRGRIDGDCVASCGIGCQTMQFRAASLGGTFAIRNLPGGGSAVIVTAPLARPEHAPQS